MKRSGYPCGRHPGFDGGQLVITLIMAWHLRATSGNERQTQPKPMSTSPQESPSDTSASVPAREERLVAFEREDGAVVIYDEREHTAWLQSSDAVAVTDAR